MTIRRSYLTQQGDYLANIMSKRYELSPPVSDGVFLSPVMDPERTKVALSDTIANFTENNRSSS